VSELIIPAEVEKEAEKEGAGTYMDYPKGEEAEVTDKSNRLRTWPHP